MKRLLILFATLLIASEVIYAQEIIVKNDGSVINAYRTDYHGSVIYYQTEDTDAGAIYRIKKEDVLVIRFSDGRAITPNVEQPAQTNEAGNKTFVNEENTFPDIDLTDYHGFLLDKGNCVYVACNSKVDYELAAVDIIKQAIKENGLWKVVDKPSQAHFVLQYNVCLSGRDHGRVHFRPRDNYLQVPYLDFSGGRNPAGGSQYFLCGLELSNEEVGVNVTAAQSIITRVLQHYKEILESAAFMECVKTGKYYKAKDSTEKWYVYDHAGLCYEANDRHMKSLHDLFYK